MTVDGDFTLVDRAAVVLRAQRVPQALRQPLRQRLRPAADRLLGRTLRLEGELPLEILLGTFFLRRQGLPRPASEVASASNARAPQSHAPHSRDRDAVALPPRSTQPNPLPQLRHLLLEAPRLPARVRQLDGHPRARRAGAMPWRTPRPAHDALPQHLESGFVAS